jgi:hypothetical protein
VNALIAEAHVANKDDPDLQTENRWSSSDLEILWNNFKNRIAMLKQNI